MGMASLDFDRVVRSPLHAVWMLFAIFLLDLTTPADVQVFALFVVPVAFAAWFGGRRAALLAVTAVAALRVTVHYLQPSPSSLTISLVNGVIRLGVLVLVAFLVDRVATQRRRLRVLEGMLSICAFCKRIRTPENDWEQMEHYISAHSEVTFSHGVCPTCMMEHYTDVASSGRG